MSIQTFNKQNLTLVLMSTFLLTTLGCKGLGLRGEQEPTLPIEATLRAPIARNKPLPSVENGEFKEPAKLVVIWQEAAYAEPGKQSIRGFGGRVYFYDTDDEPVLCDGTIVVYGFDDTNGKSKREADKKWVFEKEHLQSRMGMTSLGPGYNIWCPWDEVGGYRKTINLAVVFRSAGGAVVKGELIENELSGKTTPEDSFVKFFKGTQLGSADQLMNSKNSNGEAAPGSENLMQTHDIKLPNHVGARIAEQSQHIIESTPVGVQPLQVKKSQIRLGDPVSDENGNQRRTVERIDIN